jgi:hypothetical protein
METRNIKIDLTTARTWYKQGGDLKQVALQAFSENELVSQLPTSYREYLEVVKPKIGWRICGCPCATAEQATQFEILCKLIRIKDYYNQGWKPNWCDGKEDKFVISTNRNELCTCTSWFTNYIFTFKTQELRDEFFNNFKEDLEFIKEFL